MSVRSSTDSTALSTPAAATQATASLAAPAVATLKWVCTSISATFATGATAQAGALQLNLRNGASGAGAIIWSKQIILPVGGVWEVNLSDLNIPGAYGVAMTLEFSAAGVAGSFQSVNLTGYQSA